MEVSIDLIRSSPYQPRLYFEVEELREEIERDGLLSPLIVRKVNGYYELIDGERRLRALKEIGWKKVPVEIRELDDEVARLAIFKLNTIRAGYKTEELAKYFKRLHDEGMTFYQIARDLGIKNDQWVLAHINVFKLPEEIQRDVWEGAVTVSHIMEMESIIGAGLIDETIKYLNEVKLRKLTKEELRETLVPRLQEIERARVEAAKKAVGPRGPISVKLEEPRELEKAAKALLEEAKKKREEALKPEEKAELERKREEKRRRAEQARKALEEKIRAKVEREAEKKAEEKLLGDRKFLQKAREELLKIESIPIRGAREEIAVKEGIAYTIGELDCDRCGKHYVIKCDGKRNWLE